MVLLLEVSKRSVSCYQRRVTVRGRRDHGKRPAFQVRRSKTGWCVYKVKIDEHGERDGERFQRVFKSELDAEKYVKATFVRLYGPEREDE